jgi:hypothetical protein
MAVQQDRIYRVSYSALLFVTLSLSVTSWVATDYYTFAYGGRIWKYWGHLRVRDQVEEGRASPEEFPDFDLSEEAIANLLAEARYLDSRREVWKNASYGAAGVALLVLLVCRILPRYPYTRLMPGVILIAALFMAYWCFWLRRIRF